MVGLSTTTDLQLSQDPDSIALVHLAFNIDQKITLVDTVNFLLVQGKDCRPNTRLNILVECVDLVRAPQHGNPFQAIGVGHLIRTPVVDAVVNMVRGRKDEV